MNEYCAARRKNMLMRPTDNHIIYSTAFAVAEREVCVFTGDRDQQYGDDFAAAAQLFLSNPQHRLRVACQCGNDIANCPIIKRIAEHHAGSLIVYDASRYAGEAPYFLTLDDTGYRLEASGTSFVNYGDAVTNKHLRDQYERIAKNSEILIQMEAATLQ